MKKFAALFVLMLMFTVSFAQSAAPHYKQVAKYTPGGDGFWDLLTYDPATSRLFIAHGDIITVIDTNTGKSAGTVPAAGAHGIAVIPEKHLGFSTNGRTGTVTVFDTQTLQTKTDIKAGENPDAILYDEHSKQIVVMNGRSKDLTVIDPATNKVVATVPVGGKPELAASDARRVYVNIEDTGEIVSVDPTNWKIEKRWKLDGCEEPSGLAIDESSHHLFAACGNKKMVVVDNQTGKIVGTVATGGGTDGAGYDPGLKLAFAPNGEGSLSIVRDGGNGKYEVDNVTTQRGARTMTVDPKSHRVFLPTAELGPPAEGQRRPSIKPGSFIVLVYAPEN